MVILDRVKFDGLRSRDWLIYKYPSEQLVFGTQLIVNEGQVAVFVKGGTVCDIFSSGTYTLDTDNMPILKSIMNIPFGGRTPFSAEIYYLNTTSKLDLPWGTSDPIQIIDPKYYVKLRVRAFGQMGVKLVDYHTFFTELIGSMNQADLVSYDKITSFYKGILITKLKALIAELIIENKISVLEIASKLDDLSDSVKIRISEEFVKYGLSIASFYIQSINFPDEDFNKINKILEDKAAFEIMGDHRYATKRSFDVYEGAAINETGAAGALLAGGVGIGAGMSMCNHMDHIVESPHNSVTMRTCQSCGAKVTASAKFCNSCGKSMEDKKIICNKCNAPNKEGAKFCKDCGNNLQSKVCECGAILEADTRFCSQCGKKAD